MGALKNSRKVARFHVGDHRVKLLVRGGHRVFPEHRVIELSQLMPLTMRMVTDTENFRMEVGFTSPGELTGSATAGWTDERGLCNLRLENSFDLATWESGNFEDCPGSPTDNLDGTFTYWSRCSIAVWWIAVMVDYSMTSNRYGKTIESLTINDVEIALDYPYAMPADCATLQADLRTAGYTDSVVSSTTAALSVGIEDHGYADNAAYRHRLTPTLSGSNVTNVAFRTTNITLPSYPYAMPSQRAALQADLRTAGYSGAVVMLYDDPWEIIIPDQAADANFRVFKATISPGDPHPYWNIFGVYQGLNPQTQINGSSGNVRTPEGDPLEESLKQFARLKITQA